MAEIEVQAVTEKLEEVLGFIEEQMEKEGCDSGQMITVSIMIEEMFVNIAMYAYAPGAGAAKIRCSFEKNPRTLVIEFIDAGKPYNPLEKPDPDITLSAEERGIGGLGIFMVKESMDFVDYKYQNGENHFTMKKILE